MLAETLLGITLIAYIGAVILYGHMVAWRAKPRNHARLSRRRLYLSRN